MASRFTTLALLTLAALVNFTAGASSARGQDVDPVSSALASQGQAPRRARLDVLDVSESPALQSAAIEDSEENSAGRNRADETRYYHDIPQNASRTQGPGALRTRHRDATPCSLIYRFCKLLI